MQDYNFQLFNKWYFYHKWAKSFASIFTISIWRIKHHDWQETNPGIPAISLWGGKNE